MIRYNSVPATAVCDGCGAEGATIELRSRRGTLVYAFLPEAWKLTEVAHPQHLCGGCCRAAVSRLEAA